jgi:mono/diheme cytochrome c family protein
MELEMAMRFARAGMVAGAIFSLTLSGIAAAQETPKGGDPAAAKLVNPIPSSPASIAAGKATFDMKCVPCHGPKADGNSQVMIEGGVRPADLTRPKYTYGTADGQIFTNIRDGVLPNLNMPTWDGQISETDMWNIVNFLKSIRPAE